MRARQPGSAEVSTRATQSLTRMSPSTGAQQLRNAVLRVVLNSNPHVGQVDLGMHVGVRTSRSASRGS